MCHSTVCENDHKFCEQTCRAHQACLGTFIISPNHTLTARTFQWHTVPDQDCLATTCQITRTTASLGVCCCRTDYCNIVSGLFGDLAHAPPIIPPTPHGRHPTKQLVCEFNNCTSSSVSSCYHGYEICALLQPVPEVSFHANIACAVYARSHDSLYELQSKGCIIMNNTNTLNHSIGQSECFLDTMSTTEQIECYCNHSYCNYRNDLNIMDPQHLSPEAGPGVSCDSLGCNHSCIIEDNMPRCLCPTRYALDPGLQTCTGKFLYS